MVSSLMREMINKGTRMELLQTQMHEFNGTGGKHQKETFLGPELDNVASRPVFHLQEHHLVSGL